MCLSSVKLKQLLKQFSVVCLIGLFSSCTRQSVDTSRMRIGLVLDKGGKDDRSFNASAFQGADEFRKKFNVYLKYVESTDDNAFEDLLRFFAQRKFDLVIAVGVSQTEAIRKMARQFPEIRFVLIDGETPAPNVRSIVFQEHEGSFLVGAIAAKVTKTRHIGFIGGMEIPMLKRFQKGYEAGARFVQPGIKISAHYVGITEDAWNNPARAKELSMIQYDSGVDVIFSAAGASASGVFDAAEERHRFAIGVDSNQNWVKPGFVLTSMVKKVDRAVFDICQATLEGKFVGGTARFGLANGGVDYALDEYNKNLLTPEIIRFIDDLKQKVISEKVKVPDLYEEKKMNEKGNDKNNGKKPA